MTGTASWQQINFGPVLDTETSLDPKKFVVQNLTRRDDFLGSLKMCSGSNFFRG